MSHALIVEDDSDSAEMMAALVSTENFTVAIARTLRDARRQIALQQPDIVLLDLQLSYGNGMELFTDQALLAQSEVVLITDQASFDTSIQALRLGAVDYLVKPVNVKHLQGILSRVMRPTVLTAEVETLTAEWQHTGHFGGLWGRSDVMQHVYKQISRVAGTSVTVLVTGESGTDKEIVARTVHELSRRRNRAFLAVNCGAISPNLMESEIFGHEKGSFTSADRQHLGFFERSHGGMLFLDEITEMPLEFQVKLLRGLETGMFMRVGSIQNQDTDVSIIAATNRVPNQAVAIGKLREDLYYRLNVFPIVMPSLRERPDDVGLLAEHFLSGVIDKEGRVKRFSPAALTRLSAYRWPGNVRELRNVVQRAYVMATEEIISDEWLPTHGQDAGIGQQAAGSAAQVVHKVNDVARITIPLANSMADAEYQLILATLKHCRYHKERTAAVLGINLKTLYNGLKEYGAANKPEEIPPTTIRRRTNDRRRSNRNCPTEDAASWPRPILPGAQLAEAGNTSFFTTLSVDLR